MEFGGCVMGKVFTDIQFYVCDKRHLRSKTSSAIDRNF